VAASPPPPRHPTPIVQASAQVSPTRSPVILAAYQPPAPSEMQIDSRCHPADSFAMCEALVVVFDAGELFRELDAATCDDTAGVLDRHAGEHRRQIADARVLGDRESAADLDAFTARHRERVSIVLSRALELDARCDGHAGIDRALRRLGFKI
jgi:hypothetical protein